MATGRVVSKRRSRDLRVADLVAAEGVSALACYFLAYAHADRFGMVSGDARILRGEACPLLSWTEAEVDRWMTAWHRAGMAVRYRYGRMRVVWFPDHLLDTAWTYLPRERAGDYRLPPAHVVNSAGVNHAELMTTFGACHELVSLDLDSDSDFEADLERERDPDRAREEAPPQEPPETPTSTPPPGPPSADGASGAPPSGSERPAAVAGRGPLPPAGRPPLPPHPAADLAGGGRDRGIAALGGISALYGPAVSAARDAAGRLHLLPGPGDAHGAPAAGIVPIPVAASGPGGSVAVPGGGGSPPSSPPSPGHRVSRPPRAPEPGPGLGPCPADVPAPLWRAAEFLREKSGPAWSILDPAVILGQIARNYPAADWSSVGADLMAAVALNLADGSQPWTPQTGAARMIGSYAKTSHGRATRATSGHGTSGGSDRPRRFERSAPAADPEETYVPDPPEKPLTPEEEAVRRASIGEIFKKFEANIAAQNRARDAEVAAKATAREEKRQAREAAQAELAAHAATCRPHVGPF